MKLKNIVALFLLSFAFLLVGCEDSTMIKSAFISEATSAGSDEYVLRINFQTDSRLESESVDVLIKTDKPVNLTFWEENQDKLTLTFDKSDYWESLTHLITLSKGESGRETFEKFAEVTNKSYIFKSEEPVNLTFRVIAGQVQDNGDGTGQILIGTDNISEEFVLKIK